VETKVARQLRVERREPQWALSPQHGKTVVLGQHLDAGTRLTRDMVTSKSPGLGLSPQLIDQLVGRTIAIVFNLKPAKLMGIESNGMVLAASPEGGGAKLVMFDGDVAPGTRIR